MATEYIKRILRARVYDIAQETPIDHAALLSQRLGNEVLFKREDLQPVFSFKLRGSYNKIANLSADEQARGVIAASAGNHAQGLALGASRLGIKAVIVMPRTTPEIKVAAVKARGGTVVLEGDSFIEAYNHAMALMEREGYIFCHPYDDPDVIAGQGTVAMEILRQRIGGLNAVFVPVGGGGLIAGMAVYIKYLYPEIRVVGVESEDSACFFEALKQGRRAKLSQVGLFADGVAVAQMGEEPYRIARDCVDEVITVTTDEICAAIKDVFNDTRSVMEPAGALATAGLKKYALREHAQGQSLLAVTSGANVNFDSLGHISERTQLGEQREAILGVTIKEEPGSFQNFCQALGNRTITEFNYRYSNSQNAHVFVGVQLQPDGGGREQLVQSLRDMDYEVADMSDNEMAKLHVRHMVGGYTQAGNEQLYRFEFPQKPGALLHFLSQLGEHWNISLFHYRNHGAAYGRVLAGLQVQPAEEDKLRGHVASLGYRYWEETDNPAYRLFLEDV